MHSTTKFGTFKLRVHYSNILWYNSNWFCLKFRCSIMVNILGCHAGDLGSFPGGEEAAEACSFSSACLQTITDNFFFRLDLAGGFLAWCTTPWAPPGTPHLGTICPYNAITPFAGLTICTHPSPIRVSLWGGSGAPIKDPSSPKKISHSLCLKVKVKNEQILKQFFTCWN